MHDDDWPFHYNDPDEVARREPRPKLKPEPPPDPPKTARRAKKLSLATPRRPGTVGKLRVIMDRRRSETVTDNTPAGSNNMPTVIKATAKPATTTKPAATRAKKPSGSSANKAAAKAKKDEAAKNTDPVILAFPPDEKKADTKPGEKGGALRFSEVGIITDGDVKTDDHEPLVGTLYLRKEQAAKLWGQLPTGFEVTLTPTFD